MLNRFDRAADIGIEPIRKALGDAALVTVPNSYREVSLAINHGSSVAAGARGGLVARQLAALAAVLIPREPESRNFVDRIFRRA